VPHLLIIDARFYEDLADELVKGAVAAIGPPPPGQEGKAAISPVRVAVGLTGRYALLLGAGYVMIGRLHLHPLGVLVGVSAVVVAAMLEAVRSWR